MSEIVKEAFGLVGIIVIPMLLGVLIGSRTTATEVENRICQEAAYADIDQQLPTCKEYKKRVMDR